MGRGDRRGRGRGAVAAAVLAVAAGACTGGNAPARAVPDAPDVPVAATSTPTSPAPTPTQDLAAVAGERVPGAHWVDATGLLTHDRPEPTDPAVVLPFVHAVGDWLDAHLDDLQRGGNGRLDEVAAPALLAAATPADLDTVTTALASPDRPVAAATYQLDASYADEVEWLTATVTVTDPAGDTAEATLVFVPGATGPELVLLGSTEVAP